MEACWADGGAFLSDRALIPLGETSAAASLAERLICLFVNGGMAVPEELLEKVLLFDAFRADARAASEVGSRGLKLLVIRGLFGLLDWDVPRLTDLPIREEVVPLDNLDLGRRFCWSFPVAEHELVACEVRHRPGVQLGGLVGRDDVRAVLAQLILELRRVARREQLLISCA